MLKEEHLLLMEDYRQAQIEIANLQSSLATQSKEIEELKAEVKNQMNLRLMGINERDSQSARIKELEEGIEKMKAVAESHLQLPKETVVSYCNQILSGQVDKEERGEG